MRTITIEPITRLEGHGKIVIRLDDAGEVERAVLQVPELRGFEAFVVGRAVEDLPQITSRICGICPTAHHMAATKALDDLYKVEPPPAARKIRELAYTTSWRKTTRCISTFWAAPISSSARALRRPSATCSASSREWANRPAGR